MKFSPLNRRMSRPPGEGTGPARFQAAFTMVEIALCLAVIGFALVAIIGVLPTGLSVQKDNREETIINFEANFLMDAIRSGSLGQGELTNHIIALTNMSYLCDSNGFVIRPIYTNSFTNYFGSQATRIDTKYFATNVLAESSNIIGLLTMRKYPPPTGLLNGQFFSNYVCADFRAISGPATELGTNDTSQEFAFRYRVEAEIVMFGDRQSSYDPAWTNFQAAGLAPEDVAYRTSYYAMAKNMEGNFGELRLRFKWPVLANGKTGAGRQVFRSAITGRLDDKEQILLTRATAVPLLFIQPTGYTNLQPQGPVFP